MLSLFLVAAILGCSACAPSESSAERQRDACRPAGEAGQGAHEVAVEAEKAGKVSGWQIGKAAHDAREGWKEAARKDEKK